MKYNFLLSSKQLLSSNCKKKELQNKLQASAFKRKIPSHNLKSSGQLTNYFLKNTEEIGQSNIYRIREQNGRKFSNNREQRSQTKETSQGDENTGHEEGVNGDRRLDIELAWNFTNQRSQLT